MPSALVPVEIAANMIGILIGDITAQIDARDHKLVEQSDGLVVLRPVYKGNPSSGVLEEIKYHCQLCATGVERRVGLWIYTDVQDEFAYLARTWLVGHLVRGLRQGSVRGSGDEAKVRSAIDEVANSLTYSDDRKKLALEILEKLSGRGIRYIGQYEDKPLAGRVEMVSVDAHRQFVRAVEEVRPPHVQLIEDYVDLVPELRVVIRQGPDISVDKFLGEFLESCGHENG
jgi:hypothetical protein